MMKVVVLAGGISTERDVSIVSGTMVCKALRERGHRAVLLDVFIGREPEESEDAFPADYDLEADIAYIKSYNDRIEELKKEKRDFFGPNVLKLCREADIVFLALHGENGENGKVQGAFDLFNIRYTGTGCLGSALSMDKGLSKTILQDGGVPVPGGIVLKKGECSTLLADYDMEFPVVVKPCCGGSSVGVFIVHDQTAYEDAVATAFAYEDEIVVEDYICGREFSVGVVEGKAYPVIEIAPVEGFYDYKNKYSAGAAVETCPAELTEEQTRRMQAYAEEGSRLLMNEGYSRLDFLMDEEGDIFCLEANTLPGMTPTSLLPQEAKATGIGFPELCELLIQCSLKKYEKSVE